LTLPETSLRGQLLVAMPNMEDPNFHKTVILICEANDEGAMGVIVNRPLPFTLGQVFEGQEIEEREYEGDSVHFGGPVQPEVGFILYTGGNDYASSLLVDKGVHLGTSLDILRDIAKGSGPERFLFALGYAGWGPEQLESEVARNDWLLVPLNPELIFTVSPERRWDKAVRSLGIEPALLVSGTGTA
jgi:putative transcriptional regulator